KVDRIETYGVFVRIGPGQVGLVPNEEMGTERGADHKKDFPPGTEVDVEILAVEEGGKRIRLSLQRGKERRAQDEAERYRGGGGGSRGGGGSGGSSGGSGGGGA